MADLYQTIFIWLIYEGYGGTYSYAKAIGDMQGVAFHLFKVLLQCLAYNELNVAAKNTTHVQFNVHAFGIGQLLLVVIAYSH